MPSGHDHGTADMLQCRMHGGIAAKDVAAAESEGNDAVYDMIDFDKKMKYGEYQGLMYSEILAQQPGYIADLRGGAAKRKNCPKYVTEYLSWVDGRGTSCGSKDVPTRNRGGLPEKQPNPCKDGCK